jgi:hypothetical protein
VSGELGGQYCFGVHDRPDDGGTHPHQGLLRCREFRGSGPGRQICLCGELGGDNTASGYTIDPATGALTLIKGSPFAAGLRFRMALTARSPMQTLDKCIGMPVRPVSSLRLQESEGTRNIVFLHLNDRGLRKAA